MNKQSRLTTYILIGLVLGIITGYFAHDNLASPTGFADTMALITTLFLRLIKMIIAPLVFSTLVCGIAKMGDATAVGRVGVKTLGWFFIASVMSLSLGLVLVNIFRPGDALLGHMAATAAKADLATSA
jgi:Na+/H+-dicarboxylate symporter